MLKESIFVHSKEHCGHQASMKLCNNTIVIKSMPIKKLGHSLFKTRPILDSKNPLRVLGQDRKLCPEDLSLASQGLSTDDKQ